MQNTAPCGAFARNRALRPAAIPTCSLRPGISLVCAPLSCLYRRRILSHDLGREPNFCVPFENYLTFRVELLASVHDYHPSGGYLPPGA